MRIGLEVMAAVLGRRAGVGQYTDNLVRALEQQSPSIGEFEFIYFANKYAPVVDELGPYLKEEDIYPRYQMQQYLLWLQGWLPRAIAATSPDLCHFPNFLAPLLPISCPFVLTIHDMSAFLEPENHTKKMVWIQRTILPQVARRAKLVIADSEVTRQDVLRLLKLPSEKVRVVYAGVSDHFKAEPDPVTEERIRQIYNLNFPFVLAVGTLEPRKNQVRLIEAFSRLVKQERLPHHLVMVGGQGWKDSPVNQAAEREGIMERIHFLGYLPRQDLPHLYRLAEVFAFPSLKEGFGLPVLEAMACGTPVLISTDPALLEIGGNATLAVDPLSVEGITAGLHSLLTDSAKANSLREAGLQRVQLFSWKETANQMLQIYREAANTVVG